MILWAPARRDAAVGEAAGDLRTLAAGVPMPQPTLPLENALGTDDDDFELPDKVVSSTLAKEKLPATHLAVAMAEEMDF